MKKLLFLSFMAVAVAGYSQSWKHSNMLGGTEDISVIKSTTDQDHNIIIFGHFTGTITPQPFQDFTPVATRGQRDYFIAKFDTLSNLLWVKGMGSTMAEFFDGGAHTDLDNNIYITGSFQGTFYYTATEFLTSAGSHDIFLAKLDPDGNVLWCHNAGTNVGLARSNALRVDKAGDILLGGHYADSIKIYDDTTLYANEFKDYFYAKFSPADGSLIWAHALKSIDTNYSGFIYSFSAADDHYIISGVFADSVDIGIDTLVSNTPNLYDTHIFKTDLDGNILWKRIVKGIKYDYSYTSTLDPDDNIYITGYYNSSDLIFDVNETETTTINQLNGGYDFFIAKYDAAGNLEWARVNGGTGDDRLLRSSFFEGRLWVSGYFTNQLQWGSTVLTTTGGASDVDAFYGSIDPDGNYTGARQFRGRTNSTEWGQAVFSDTVNLYAVIRTNSDLFVAEDSSYINPTKKYVVVVGAIGCFPISVTANKILDVTGCYGDSTGIITVNATDGYGDFQYSIGDDYPYQSSPLFENLPAGLYPTSAIDQKGCYEPGPVITINQPAELVVTQFDSTDVLCNGESTGTITVNATGGTGALSYSIDCGATYPHAVGNAASVPAGIYCVRVKDNNNCDTLAGSATILEPEVLSVALDSTQDAECHGTATGRIEMSAGGGIAPYEFSIDGSTYQSDSVFAAAAGTYSVMIRDANGCEATGETGIVIKDSAAIEISVISNEPQVLPALGVIVVSATGETGSYEFTITPDEGTTQDPAGTFSVPAVTYNIEVIDSNCGASASTGPIIVLGSKNLSVFNSTIYPNPTSGLVTIEFATEKAEMTMEIYAIDGRNVMSRQVYSSGGRVNETFDLSTLEKGMYLVRVDNLTLSSPIVIK